MSSHCPTCNHRNAARQTQCTVCGRKLNLTKRNPSPAVSVYPTGHFAQSELIMSKMAVFDIDHTITDPSRREKAARREGYLIGSMPTSKYPKGKKTFIEWFDDPAKFRTDTAYPGAVDYVNGLAQRGYVIGYITGRRAARKPQTSEHLQELGFPIFNGADDQPLLFMKSSPKQTTSAWKFDILKKLQHNYDIHYFFDDLAANRDAAFRLNIPGIYHLPSHIKSPTTGDTVESNPRNIGQAVKEVMDHHLPGSIEYGTPIEFETHSDLGKLVMELAWELTGKEPYGPFRDLGEEGTDALSKWFTETYGAPIRVHRASQASMYVDNIVVAPENQPYGWQQTKHLTGRISNNPSQFDTMLRCQNCGGDLRREGCHHRGLHPTRRAPPSRKPPLPYGRGFTNPIPPHDEAQREPKRKRKGKKKGKKKATVETVAMRLDEGQSLFGGGDYHRRRTMPEEDWQEMLEEQGYGANPPWPSNYRQAAGCIVMKKGKILMLRRSHKETSKHGLWELPGGKLEEGETPEEAACNETLEEAGLEVRILDRLEPHIDHKMKKVYHGFLAEPIDSNARVRLSEEHDRNKWVGLDQVMKWSKIKKKKISHHAVFLFSQLKSDEARGNPPSSRKLKKAEELYRVFNNKEPENVRKEKIDIGDVWYRVGEGGAWCIGYMSGKETGDEEQRYIHNFNEESKDGDFPEIYATLPDSGKPLIIIRGGSFKIKTDKNGVAWIYD